MYNLSTLFIADLLRKERINCISNALGEMAGGKISTEVDPFEDIKYNYHYFIYLYKFFGPKPCFSKV